MELLYHVLFGSLLVASTVIVHSLCIVIMLKHYLNDTASGTLIPAESMMPLFYQLSGFSLTVAYGHKFSKPDSVFDKKSFYWNRLIRTLPVVWICNTLALPKEFMGYSTRIPWFTGWYCNNIWNRWWLYVWFSISQKF